MIVKVSREQENQLNVYGLDGKLLEIFNLKDDLQRALHLLKQLNSIKTADGIKKVLQDEELATKLAENAHRDAQQYSWEKRAEKILEFVEESHAQ